MLKRVWTTLNPRRRVNDFFTRRAAWLAGPLAVALVAALLFVPYVWRNYWEPAELFGFDELTVATAPNKIDLPIVIIGIDDESLQALGIPWPWPRSVHAELIDKLAKAKPVAIGMDVVFDLPSQNPEDDAKFAAAIKRAGNVVLAADRQVKEDNAAGVVAYQLMEPLPVFLQAGAVTGYANVEFGARNIVRTVASHDESFWKQLARRLAKVVPNDQGVANPPPGAMFRYLGDVGTVPYYPYAAILKAEQKQLDEALGNALVLVGRNLRVTTEINMAAADLFFTPFTSRSKTPTPGVELHATMVANAFERSWIIPAGRFWAFFTALTSIAIAVLAMRRWHPLWSLAALLVILAALGGLDWALFKYQSTWLPIGAAIVGSVFVYLWLGGVYYLIFRRRFLTSYRALLVYLPPEVAKRVAEDPQLSRLGGVRRQVTLMFTDLAGFTKVSEKLPPERVSALLNRHFTEMVTLIQETMGTVDKFIGDAIMAFWGAPLDDPDHAYKAVTVAMRMQEAMHKLRDELVADGLPAIHMRIGINTGDAAVGNMGAEQRLAYTAIGDAVNLAARLEGINKLYGTPIICSESTASLIRDRVPLRMLDRVRVAGKSEPVTIYTPSRGSEIEVKAEQAFAAYLRSDFAGSLALWNEILAVEPENKNAKVFIERIDEFLREPPPPGWDGSVALEKF